MRLARDSRAWSLWALVPVLAWAASAAGVVIYDPVTPRRNTIDPGDASGWHLQGLFRMHLGTPIGPEHFITAGHISNQTLGSNIVFNSGPNAGRYRTLAVFDDPNTDLRVWQIDGTFNQFAPLYLKGDEVAKPLTVFGRGRAPGAEVIGPESRPNRTELKGWQWGLDDKVLSWGRNTISGVTSTQSAEHVLLFEFNAIAGADEAGLSGRDSGGGVFIQDIGGRWKLAGINLGSPGPFQLDQNGTPTGDPFNATLFDMGGLHLVGSDPPCCVPDRRNDVAAAAAATRISSNLDWIGTIVPQAVPEPGTLALLVAGIGLASRRRAGLAVAPTLNCHAAATSCGRSFARRVDSSPYARLLHIRRQGAVDRCRRHAGPCLAAIVE